MMINQNELFQMLGCEKWLEYNAKLQSKKNTLRKTLKDKGVLTKDKENKFDNYSYFSEAGYKKLFTELLSEHSLELTSNEASYESFTSTNPKMPNGRKVTFEFILTDCETGFFEVSKVSGEGLDKGDKAGYKADTGALKYYLANTFMVATGDDAENESPEAKTEPKATPKQIQMLSKCYYGENLTKLLQSNNITKLEELPKSKAIELISKLYAGKEQQ